MQNTSQKDNCIHHNTIHNYATVCKLIHNDCIIFGIDREECMGEMIDDIIMTSVNHECEVCGPSVAVNTVSKSGRLLPATAVLLEAAPPPGPAVPAVGPHMKPAVLG